MDIVCVVRGTPLAVTHAAKRRSKFMSWRRTHTQQSTCPEAYVLVRIALCKYTVLDKRISANTETAKVPPVDTHCTYRYDLAPVDTRCIYRYDPGATTLGQVDVVGSYL